MISQPLFRFGLGILFLPLSTFSLPPPRSPLQTIEMFHKALGDSDAPAAASLLHDDYHGVSLQGSPDHRHVYVETREKAISDVAGLKPGEWDVRILHASTETDPHGMGHVWASYVFYLNGNPNHCGHESYVLYQTGDGWKIVSFADTDNPLNGKSPAEVCPED